jgi:hypothetical protein
MNSNYLFKIWLSTITVTPLLFIIVTIVGISGSHLDSETAGFYLFSLLYGIIFSVPTLIVFLLLSFFLDNKIKNTTGLKIYYLSISLICMIITIRILFGNNSYNLNGYFGGLAFTVLYGISIIGFGLIYKIK